MSDPPFSPVAPVILEVCVESLRSALAARDGGADRLEVCADLEHGGVTPDPSLVREILRAVDIPVHAMVRPRAGDFIYSGPEYELMRKSVAAFGDLGCAGIVTGLLTAAGDPDSDRTADLVRLAGTMDVTFHRAIDVAPDITSAASVVAGTGVRRILTSGGEPTAARGAAVISRLVKMLGDVSFIAAGGISAENAREIVRATGVREIHSWKGTSESRPAGEAGNVRRETDARLVASLKKAMGGPG